MKTKLQKSFLALALFACAYSAFSQVGTAFTYQGRLNSSGAPVNGNFDFQFITYDNGIGGSQQGSVFTTNLVPVSNGLFTVTLDFGAVFTGAQRWLDISVRTNGGGSFTPLAPRQNLSPTPYAVYAANAGNAATATTATSAASATTATTANNLSGSLSGDVTGTQGATVTAKVGGVAAANVAAGANAANGATNVNIVNTIVRRDAFGSFNAGIIAAASLVGNGAGVTGLNAGNVSSGTLADARLSSNVPLLNTSNGFTGKLFVSGSSAGDYNNPQALVFNSNASGSTAPALRALGYGNSPYGVLSVSSIGTGLIAQFGNASTFVADITTNGTIDATGLNVNTGAGSLSIVNDGGATPGLVATGGLAPGHFRLRNGVEIFPNSAQTAGGYLDVRGTSGGATISLTGTTGAIIANSLSASSITGGLGTNFYLNDHAVYLRNDVNHGLGYNGSGVTNFPSASVMPDGPVLWGFGGGALGVLNGGAKSALSWNNSGVTVSGNLSANNTPGVNYSQNNSIYTAIPNNGYLNLASEGNAKVAPGYFIINAFARGNGLGNYIALELVDVSGSPVVLNTVGCNTTVDTEDTDYGGFTLSMSWVVPITVANGYQNFGIIAYSDGKGHNQAYISGYNLTVLYVPRLNN